jgi:hypothetical protein
MIASGFLISSIALAVLIICSVQQWGSKDRAYDYHHDPDDERETTAKHEEPYM